MSAASGTAAAAFRNAEATGRRRWGERAPGARRRRRDAGGGAQSQCAGTRGGVRREKEVCDALPSEATPNQAPSSPPSLPCAFRRMARPKAGERGTALAPRGRGERRRREKASGSAVRDGRATGMAEMASFTNARPLASRMASGCALFCAEDGAVVRAGDACATRGGVCQRRGREERARERGEEKEERKTSRPTLLFPFPFLSFSLLSLSFAPLPLISCFQRVPLIYLHEHAPVLRRWRRGARGEEGPACWRKTREKRQGRGEGGSGDARHASRRGGSCG